MKNCISRLITFINHLWHTIRSSKYACRKCVHNDEGPNVHCERCIESAYDCRPTQFERRRKSNRAKN